MQKPKVFIGSSKKNIKVAEKFARALEADDEVDVTVWNEGVFRLNRSIFEELLEKPDEFDFAVLVLAPDDMILSNEVTHHAARDNVLFECGLFLGRFGRDRVFIVHDESINLKIPSDLKGVTLATYDGAKIADSNLMAGVREACARIIEAIKRPMYTELVGEWRTIYRLTSETGNPLAYDDIEIKSSKGGVALINKNNDQNDYYEAQGNLAEARLLMGKWKANKGSGTISGVFVLTINPRHTIMYGYSTGLNEMGGTVFATWILTKKDVEDEEVINKRLKTGEVLLKQSTLWTSESDA